MNYRLYSFVAHHYLSQLQCGLQTAHVVSEMSRFRLNTPQYKVYSDWSINDKTIVILGAGNHAGVQDASVKCLDLLSKIKEWTAPQAIFYEDEQSMNRMATACGVIVPDFIYDAIEDDTGQLVFGGHYYLEPEEIEFYRFLKSYRLA